MIDVLSAEGTEKVSSVIYRGLSLDKINKASNETELVRTTNDHSVDYYVCQHKHYDDYHMMSKKMSKKMGPYFQIENETDKDKIALWKKREHSINHCEDYNERSKNMGLKKIFLKYPYVIDFPNSWRGRLNKIMRNYDRFDEIPTVVSYFEEGEMEHHFSDLDRPVSTDEIILLKGVK
jgi:hypothetical protein